MGPPVQLVVTAGHMPADNGKATVAGGGEESIQLPWRRWARVAAGRRKRSRKSGREACRGEARWRKAERGEVRWRYFKRGTAGQHTAERGATAAKKLDGVRRCGGAGRDGCGRARPRGHGGCGPRRRLDRGLLCNYTHGRDGQRVRVDPCTRLGHRRQRAAIRLGHARPWPHCPPPGGPIPRRSTDTGTGRGPDGEGLPGPPPPPSSPLPPLPPPSWLPSEPRAAAATESATAGLQ